MNIPLSQPDVGEREIELVTQVLRSGRLSIGPRLEEFEEKFASYSGRRFAIACSSGTAALHMCTMALGIGPKDEVITTPFTFVASVNCLLYERAVPSFVDIDPATLNMDPGAIRRAIERDYIVDRARGRIVNRLSGRTLKAILPVHVFGLPCDMDSILQIAEDCGLYVIEDACEALGAKLGIHQAGNFSHAAAFAFYPNKQMTTGEGGMVVTDDPGIAKSCRELRNQGRDQSAPWLRHEFLGFNYRLSELHCALGIAQLERIEEFLAARRRAAQLYTALLADIRQIEVPSGMAGAERSWFAYVIQCKGPAGPMLRDRLLSELRARGVGCQAYFPPVHRQPYFQQIRLLPNRLLTVTEAAAQRCLALPLFSSISEEQITTVCAGIREILSEMPAATRFPRTSQRRVRGVA